MLRETRLPSGAVVLIDGEAPTGPQDVGLQTPLDLVSIRQTMVELAEGLVEPWRGLACDAVELEFSLSIEVSTGRVIALLGGGKAQGGLKVKCTWKPTP